MNGINKINYTNCNCCNNQNNINPADVANFFTAEYYKNTSNYGWNTVQKMFKHDCYVVLQDKHIGNEYDLLNIFSKDFIKRANYDDLHVKWITLPNNTVLINVFGKIQFISFSDNSSPAMQFAELFILTITDTNCINCTHHFFDV